MVAGCNARPVVARAIAFGFPGLVVARLAQAGTNE
jgi:hypothetical protein